MGSTAADKVLEGIQTDLKNLSLETKRKYSHIREGSEEAVVTLRNWALGKSPLPSIASQLLYPLVQGCETKDPKVIRICISTMQKIILAKGIDYKGAQHLIDCLWLLMEAGLEDLKVLQTITLLVTSSPAVQKETLAKCLVLCFRLHFTKDATTNNTAAATVRQVMSHVFERVVAEDQENVKENPKDEESLDGDSEIDMEELKSPSGHPPTGLLPAAADAYVMFQDLVQLVNGESPYWMQGITEMTRTFGLELIESLLTDFPSIFFMHQEFAFLLKERVCALVIKLFSPNIKSRSHSHHAAGPADKPHFPVAMRLLRLVSVLIQKYYSLLVTQCEIFLSLIIKFLDPDKPPWQRSLALEVLHQMTIQPELLETFCRSYDMKAHATKICQDILTSLGAYTQSLFAAPQLIISTVSSQASPTMAQGVQNLNQGAGMIGGLPIGPGISPQPAFCFRGIWLPITSSWTAGQAKSIYLEMLDKAEPPSIPEGYGVTLAYQCVLDTVRSLGLIIQGESKVPQSSPGKLDEAPEAKVPKDEAREERKDMCTALLNSTWCGLLSALTLLLEASTEESVTENLLKALESYGSLCGKLGVNQARDAYLIAICRASLPPHYLLSVLNTQMPGMHMGSISGHRALQRHGSGGQDSGLGNNSMAGGENELRHQVVAVGPPLPTASLILGAHQGPVMLTSKNLQCMRAILSVAHCHGDVLGTGWHIILATLQHLVWILGLKPSTGGSLKASRGTAASDGNAVITTAVMADLPILSAMLSRLFETSKDLDEVALHHLIDALCKLSQESMDMALTNRDPSLFAVAKLLETGVVNLGRVESLWRPLTSHLLEVCQHPQTKLREWGVEAITCLVQKAIQHPYKPPLKENQKLQGMLLSPLQELSSYPHPDVRQKQLESLLHILHASGESLIFAWPTILSIIGSVHETHSEQLVRLAFQCLQLVVTDFLPAMPHFCLPLTVETAACFGRQTQELNISLTAIGLMWNISDYFFQNQEKLRDSLASDGKVFPEFPGVPNMPPFDKLWMCVYTQLGELCVDSRPAVRKSAGQTLFSTISAHGGLLQQSTWQAVLWEVLFPLLENVRTRSGVASSEKMETSGKLLIHHSRNTAQKQWAETQVLALSGVSRVFNTKRPTLQQIGDFPRAWALLLEYIEAAALNRNNEVSLAALKAFTEILNVHRSSLLGPDGTSDKTKGKSCWCTAWEVWLHIGTEATKPPSDEELKENSAKELFVPTQTYLTALMHIFPLLFSNIREEFKAGDLERLCAVMEGTLHVPVHGEQSAFILPFLTDAVLTPLQDAILQGMDLLLQESLSSKENKWSELLPLLHRQFLRFGMMACDIPLFGSLPTRPVTEIKGVSSEWVTMNQVPFGEKALTMELDVYKKTAQRPSVIQAHILESIIETLQVPLSRKYSCGSPSLWRLALNILLQSLKVGLPLAWKHSNDSEKIWELVPQVFEAFLFTPEPGHPDSGEGRTSQAGNSATDELLDCEVIEFIREEILPNADLTPKAFLVKIMLLLNNGSIHSAPNLFECESMPRLKEEFAKMCFETLLQFSLLSEHASSIIEEGNLTNKLAITSLVSRFHMVLEKFVQDCHLSGKCPLPRQRTTEVQLVLKALCALLSSLRKAPPKKVSSGTWQQIIDVYPHLVDCIDIQEPRVSAALKDALKEFHHLLSPPQNALNNL